MIPTSAVAWARRQMRRVALCVTAAGAGYATGGLALPDTAHTWNLPAGMTAGFAGAIVAIVMPHQREGRRRP